MTLREDAAWSGSQRQPHSRHRRPWAALVTGSSRHARNRGHASGGL